MLHYFQIVRHKLWMNNYAILILVFVHNFGSYRFALSEGCKRKAKGSHGSHIYKFRFTWSTVQNVKAYLCL
jgi:hypothetical protein